MTRASFLKNTSVTTLGLMTGVPLRSISSSPPPPVYWSALVTALGELGKLIFIDTTAKFVQQQFEGWLKKTFSPAEADKIKKEVARSTGTTINNFYDQNVYCSGNNNQINTAYLAVNNNGDMGDINMSTPQVVFINQPKSRVEEALSSPELVGIAELFKSLENNYKISDLNKMLIPVRKPDKRILSEKTSSIFKSKVGEIHTFSREKGGELEITSTFMIDDRYRGAFPETKAISFSKPV